MCNSDDGIVAYDDQQELALRRRVDMVGMLFKHPQPVLATCDEPSIVSWKMKRFKNIEQIQSVAAEIAVNVNERYSSSCQIFRRLVQMGEED